MFSKSFKPILAAALALNFASTPVHADSFGAALVGGLIGGALLNEANKNKRRSTTTNRGTSSVTRQQNRETQTSLNYFGFPAGTPDGVMGGRSRTASSQYQAYMGFPATGRLSPYERDFLVSSYSRAQIGGPQVIKAMQSNQGARGLLLTWRDEAAGGRTASTGYGGMPLEVSNAIDEIASSSDPSAEQLMQRSGFLQLVDLNNDGRNDYIIDTSVTGSMFWCGSSHCSVQVFASTPTGYQRNDFQARNVTPASFSCHQAVCRLNDSETTMAAAPAAPAPVPQASAPVLATTTLAAAAPLGGITPFAVPGKSVAQAPSLASYCSKISLLTNSNGGYVTAASLADPEFALGEQFCLTRTYAIGVGEQIVTQLNGVSQAQIDAQCDAFGPAMASYVDQLDQTSSAQLVGDVQKFVLSSNMTLEQLANTAQICLYSGYRRDDMEVALGSALLMVGIGQGAYGELIGHHLSQGFGAPKSVDRSLEWYDVAFSALQKGAQPAFAPGQPERITLVQAAASGLGNEVVAVPVSGTALPSFSLE